MNIRYKDFAIKADEAADGNGGFTGHAATFDREPDSYGDVIAKGAFADTLKEWAESGKPIPLLYGHNMEDPDYNIGTVTAEEDETGLLVHASFDGSPKAQRVRELTREGRLYKMSVAYDVLDEAPRRDHQQGHRARAVRGAGRNRRHPRRGRRGGAAHPRPPGGRGGAARRRTR